MFELGEAARHGRLGRERDEEAGLALVRKAHELGCKAATEALKDELDAAAR